MKMAEVERKIEEEKRELGERKDDEEEEEEGKDLELEKSTSVLAGLNLVMILSSLSLSSSDEESSLNLEEVLEERESGRRNCNRRGKRSSTLPARRHEVNEFRAVERQMAKAQTKIRDCRHSRKM
ncbi:uncharacterized protein LOC105173102 [Sesamum indicum]|uniref:Uncharacterized protein LOC105173102 n=1 Tax=Sesamum indicum TaxID=4182 RepID=A0A6I9U5V8_SESIN|nr:uncharacterized protein LOC105173102 [Sesamum indicum]